MNSSIVEIHRTFIEQVSYKEEYCRCGCGAFTQQIQGVLCNGKPVVVMLNLNGYHVLIGEFGKAIDTRYLPDPVDESVMFRMIWEAVNSD